MTDIAAGNVTYSFKTRDRSPIGKLGYKSVGTMTFGNGSLTYPAGGIQLTKASLGCPHVVHALEILGSNVVGYNYEFDKTNVKLVITRVPTLTSAFTGTASNSTTLKGNVAAAGLTIAAPTINLANSGADADTNAAIFSNAGVLSHNLAAATGITGITAPTGNLANTVITIDAYTPLGSIAVTGSGAVLSQPSAVALAAMVLTVEVIGW